VDYVYSSLEEYNMFFLEFLITVDEILISVDTEAENNVANFLDEEMGVIILEWLGEEYKPFLIFPMNSDSEDEFTDEQLTKLVTALVQFSLSHPPVEEFAEVAPTRVELPMYKINIEAFFKPMPPRPVTPPPEVHPEPSEPSKAPEPTTFREALARRRTLKNRPPLVRRNTRKRIAPILR
jgi:hypothetical protein